MPNEHGQVTIEDFKAPAGRFRIMSEDMRDGALCVIGDFNCAECAKRIASCLIQDDREGDENFIFTLCNDEGEEIELPVLADSDTDERIDHEDGNAPWE